MVCGHACADHAFVMARRLCTTWKVYINPYGEGIAKKVKRNLQHPELLTMTQILENFDHNKEDAQRKQSELKFMHSSAEGWDIL
mmetsp:Transcript_5378/g.10257  ORF Transcript_5378/g.10257 Transcript_5378/m.10257 type:complete len:84 (-) Transcript_5378:259-510(-)